MGPDLRKRLEELRHYKMTPREKFEQRVSFIYGQQMDSPNPAEKDKIRRMLADHGGYPDEWKERP